MNTYITNVYLTLRRRKLLKAILVATTLPVMGFPFNSLASSASDNACALSQHEKETLVQVARTLFPHKSLSNDVYVNVVNNLVNKKDASLLRLLKSGVKSLDIGSIEWLTRNEIEQISTLKKLEQGKFFQLMHKTTIETLYRDPRVWQYIGYQGSAIEHGGYVHRGFNDIDWLP